MPSCHCTHPAPTVPPSSRPLPPSPLNFVVAILLSLDFLFCHSCMCRDSLTVLSQLQAHWLTRKACLLQAYRQSGDFVVAYFVAGHNYTVADDNICRGVDDDDDDNIMIIIIIFIGTMLDLIFVEVESFTQLFFSELYGYRLDFCCS